jgi:heme A synthase
MKLIRRLAGVALLLGFGHVVFGAIVRITGSGMGCGDHWPKCQGHWFPPLNRPDLIIEVSHRYFAATLTAAVVALLVLSWSRRRHEGVAGRGGVLRPAALATGLVVSAAVFGAFTVWLELANKLVIVTHLSLAMGLLAALVATIFRAGAPPLKQKYDPTPAPPSPFERAPHPSNASVSTRTARDAAVIASLAIVAVVLGGLTAHIPGANSACTGFPLCREGLVPTNSAMLLQLVHRLIAFTLFGWVGWLGVALTRRGEPKMAALARVLLTLLFLQLLVAGAMVELELPAVWRSLHQAVGTLIWIVAFAFAYGAHRRSRALPAADTRTPGVVTPVAEARA